MYRPVHLTSTRCQRKKTTVPNKPLQSRRTTNDEKLRPHERERRGWTPLPATKTNGVKKSPTECDRIAPSNPSTEFLRRDG